MEEYRILKTTGSNPDFVNMCRFLDLYLDQTVGKKEQDNNYAQVYL